MCYVLLILCSMSLSSCGLFFSKHTLHDPVVLFPFTVSIICSYLMMWTFFCMKTTLYPASHILTTDTNELRVSHSRIWTSCAILISCGNSNAHYLVDIFVPPFGRPTVIVLGSCFFIGVAWFDVMSDNHSVCYYCFRF